MPIRVHCPNGCLIRMPANRAGKIVRCPECKSTIELQSISKSEQQSGKPIPLTATLVEPASNTPSESHESSVLPFTKVWPANEFFADDQAQVVDDIDQSIENLVLESTESERLSPDVVLYEGANSDLEFESKLDSQSEGTLAAKTEARLNVPLGLSPNGIKQKTAAHKERLKEVLANIEPIIDVKPLDRSMIPKPVRTRRVKPPATPDSFQIMDAALNGQPLSWQERVQQSTADRVILLRFFAIGLCLVGIINMLPAIFFGIQWYQSIESTPLPRWIYCQFFIAAIHLVYAVFLFQIPHWSALRAVSVAMLAVAFVFGLVSTALLIGSGQGYMAAFLGLSFMLVQRAAIWCVAMLCLSTLISYWGGRESAQWQRSEQLLVEILS